MQSTLLDSTQPLSVSGRGLHVAIIMDGNGRWAASRGLPRVAGHRAGVGAVRRTVECANELGIECLTLYAFSSDNWRRPAHEVQSIFHLLRAYLRLESRRLEEQGVQLEIIGRRDRLPDKVVREIVRAERITSQGSRLRVRIAIDYSSRDSIARAAVHASKLLSAQTPSSNELMGRILNETLTGVSRDVDLLIRTGGEKRLSDFLLWESAYAELHFTDRMWPEFDRSDLATALQDFRRRERRFGGLPTPVPQLPLQVGGAL